MERLNPVSAFFSVTVTPGSTPPVPSVTVPDRSNRVMSARAAAGIRQTQDARRGRIEEWPGMAPVYRRSTRHCQRRIQRASTGTVPLRVFRSDVLGARPDETVVRVLLEHVRRPAGDAAHGEDRREEIHSDAQRVIGRRRVEINVRVQLLLGLHQRLDALRHLEPDRLTRALSQIARHLAQMRRARIFRVVDPMAEAGNLFLLRELRTDDFFGLLRRCALRRFRTGAA